MAGTKTGDFKELLSPFLKGKIASTAQQFGSQSPQVRALTRQYVKDPLEDVIHASARRRHYESEVQISFEDRPLVGVERLYRRTILIEPTTVCAAHCRWCLRGQYPVQTMNEDDIVHAARYFGAPGQRDDLDEVLITGGDPFMSLPLLGLTVHNLRTHAPNIRTIRIGSRVPFHDPRRINDDALALFRKYKDVRFEVGCNVNHPVEFWPESVAAIHRLQDNGVRIYNQHPLLKGVNDDFQTLVDLYALLRHHGIDAHYLFHAIPLRGMAHHRTSLVKGLDLATRISSCGEFSGRAKPRYAVLSDIGKIVLYDGVIMDRRESDNAILLRSGFRLQDRMKWNPAWQKPDSVVVEEDGTMLTWYIDGNDEPVEETAVDSLYHMIAAGQ
ncbi:MAG: radical SAM protein [Alphaproteobacteria bacterium]|jgi:lysine 2,3-aminomutase|nr:radical SAM protein [Alphaproteobacteria bacterium]